MTTESDSTANNTTITSIPAAETEDGLLRELNRFERRLNLDAQGGRPTQYEVRVDGLPVIRRTADPAHFGRVLDEVAFESTKAVEVRLFQGDSNHNHRHIILLERNRGPRPPEAQPLAGLEERFEAKLREQRASWEHEQLQREHKALQAEYDELREYTDNIDEELREYRAKRLHIGQIDLVEVGGMLLEGFVRRNPHVLAHVPGGEALAGALLATPPPAPPVQPQDSSATVSRKAAPQVSDEEMEFLHVVRRMQSRFTEQQFMQALAVLDALARHPSRIEATLACALRPAHQDEEQP